MTVDELLELMELLTKLDGLIGRDQPAHLGVMILTMHCQRLLRQCQ